MHFFVDSGIKDNMYYWVNFKSIKLYADLKKQSPTLNPLNLVDF